MAKAKVAKDKDKRAAIRTYLKTGDTNVLFDGITRDEITAEFFTVWRENRRQKKTVKTTRNK